MTEFKQLTFERTQKITQLPGEASTQLHDRLRPLILLSTLVVREPLRLITPSWYTFDASRILVDIPNSVVVSTSTCKHEIPITLFVGRRESGWQTKTSGLVEKFMYELYPLGRDLSDQEKNAIYDCM